MEVLCKVQLKSTNIKFSDLDMVSHSFASHQKDEGFVFL